MLPIRPKKYLGQNFLINARIRERIVDSCDLQSCDNVLEIGPGRGSLTELLAPKVKMIYAVEKDPRLFADLKEKFSHQKNLTLFCDDILKFPISQLPPLTKVVGNLPYNISTPIIEKFLTEPHPCQELYFTVQLEFGRRLAAQPGSKDYGALSCFIQYFCHVQILFEISPECFRPIPKVTSCFIKISFHPPQEPVADTEKLFHLIRTAFQQRRKKITNSLSSLLGEKAAEIFKKAGINKDLRAENLTLRDYIHIIKELSPSKEAGKKKS